MTKADNFVLLSLLYYHIYMSTAVYKYHTDQCHIVKYQGKLYNKA